MSEISSVSRLVAALLAFALAAGAAGTLVDLHRHAKVSGELAVRTGLMSYGRWNRQLLKESRATPSSTPLSRTPERKAR